MGDIFSIFDKIGENWREWKSVPYVFFALAGIYAWSVLEADILKSFEGYLYLALIFLGIFQAYIFVCAIHTENEKTKAAQEGDGAIVGVKKSAKSNLFTGGIGISAAVVIIFSSLLVMSATDKDGKYVIWADEYNIAMTHNVHKNYYLLGASVSTKGNEIENYPKAAVFELDFNNDGTFTIAYGDNLYGTTPGQNGVGSSEMCTSVLWTLEEVDKGVYYILNVEDNTYLKWFENMNNWTTHPSITDDNRDQYLLRLEKVE